MEKNKKSRQEGTRKLIMMFESCAILSMALCANSNQLTKMFKFLEPKDT